MKLEFHGKSLNYNLLVIAMWSMAGNDNTHVQVNSVTGDFNALATRSGNNYVGMLTIMI